MRISTCVFTMYLLLGGCASQPSPSLSTASVAVPDRDHATIARQQAARHKTLEAALEDLQSAQSTLRSQKYFVTNLNQCLAPKSDNDPKPSLAFDDDELQQKQVLCLAAAFGEAVCEGKIEHEAKQQLGSIVGAAAAGGTCYSAVNLVKSGKVDPEIASMAALASGADEAGSRMIEEGGLSTLFGYATKATAKAVKLSIVLTCVSDAEKKQKAPIVSWEARRTANQNTVSRELKTCHDAMEALSQKEQAVSGARQAVYRDSHQFSSLR